MMPNRVSLDAGEQRVGAWGLRPSPWRSCGGGGCLGVASEGGSCISCGRRAGLLKAILASNSFDVVPFQ